MLTGSLVSSIQGEPRATHDIDIVVFATPTHIEAFLAEFSPEDYYYDLDSARNATATKGMFNILATSGDKVDIWTLTTSEFDQTRFSRRQSLELFGIPVWVSSPEDTILMKLLWAKQSGGSEKQIFDASRVYELQADALNLEYLNLWIDRLGLQVEFISLKRLLFD
jgi:hypothetical protein